MLAIPLRRPATALLLAGAVTLGASGCAAFSEDAADGDDLRVAAAFYPLQYVAERVAGDAATVEAITPPGKDSHDVELTVKETASVSEADLVLHEQGFQPSLDQAIEQNATGSVLDAAAVVDLIPVAEDAAEHEEHAEEDEHAHEEHGDLDPHFWLDPARMAELGDAVAEELAELDAGRAATYRENAASLRADLEALEQEYVDGLTDCERSTVVVSHDAFGYLSRFGVDVAPVAGLSPDAEPTPADLAGLGDLIEDEGITTVFTERLASPRVTETLADDAGVRTAVLDPIEGLTDETADEDYISLMRANLTALQQANGCP